METSSQNITAHAPETVRILWTGGFDSTYRMVELSRMGCTVQPIYCRNPRRDSMDIEIQTMNKILAWLRQRKETTSLLLPVACIDRDAIPEDPRITAAYEKISVGKLLGTQYEWLARLAALYPGIEAGIEAPDHAKDSGFGAALRKYGKVKVENGRRFVDPAESDPDFLLVAGNFSLPILHLTEKELQDNLIAWGYEELLSMIWFCHEPLNGAPCGMCSACCQKMEGGMPHFLPPRAQKRYHLLANFKSRVHSPFLGETVKWLSRKLV